MAGCANSPQILAMRKPPKTDTVQAEPTQSVSAKESSLSSSNVSEDRPAPLTFDLEPALPGHRSSPSRRPSPLTEARPALENDLEDIGRTLAAASEEKGITFQFGSLYNPRPRSHHTASGGIFITTGMLRRLRDAQELAGALAWEMAELIQERKLEEGSQASGSPSGADVVDTVVSDTPKANPSCQPSTQVVEQYAQQLLTRAGYHSVDLAAIRAKLDPLAANHQDDAVPPNRHVDAMMAN